MKSLKTTAFAITLSCTFSISFAQLYTDEVQVVEGLGGNVGIGTSTPGRLLDLYSPGSVAPMRMMSGRSQGADSYIEFRNEVSAYANTRLYLGHWNSTAGRFQFQVGNGSIEPTTCMLINSNGYVGLGTWSPSERLHVNGNVRATSFISSTQTYADFVFKDGYKLRPLSEVDEYIKENKHLPDIPTEAEVIKNGMDLAAMNVKLLEKVEELTLYLIEQSAINKTQMDEIETLKKEIDHLKSERR